VTNAKSSFWAYKKQAKQVANSPFSFTTIHKHRTSKLQNLKNKKSEHPRCKNRKLTGYLLRSYQNYIGSSRR